MKNNVLGALVIFFVTVACLLMLDDIATNDINESTYTQVDIEKIDDKTSDLATVDELED